MRRSASISFDGRYRFTLMRQWGEGEPVVWMMINPSTADAQQDDATIRRCIGFSQRWGYGGLIVVNLFALRSTDPKALYRNNEATGGLRNRRAVIAGARGRDVVVAWGAAGVKGWSVYTATLAGLVGDVAESMVCLGVTKDGHPRHPVRLPYATERVPWPIGG